MKTLYDFAIIKKIVCVVKCKRVGLEMPSVEVKFRDLTIGADVQIGTRALPTLINYTRDSIEVHIP